MVDFYSLLEAKQKLENEITGRQKRLINIVTVQCGNESFPATKETKEQLENEIEDRKNALERLEAQSCCEFCGTQLDLDERLRIRLTKYSEKLPTLNVMIEKVLVTVECANCHRDYDSRQRPERIATRTEIEQAFDMLTPAEWRELRKFADWRVRGLGRAGRGCSGDDLVQEAFLSTLTGAEDARKGKRWKNSRVDFKGHLKGAIRRISWGWKRKFNAREPWLESEVITFNAEGDELSPFEKAASDDPATDQSLSVQEEIDRRFRVFANDKEATAVLQGRLAGMTTAGEIMREYKLTKRQYEAAGKRICTPRSVLVIEDYDQVLGLLVRWLKQMGYAVRTACNGVDGLRLYRECGPLDVVMISHSLKQNAVELAMNILKSNRSQRMVITTTYGSEQDVPRPSELMHIPVLLKPLGRLELRTVLAKIQNEQVRVSPAAQRCYRPNRRTSVPATTLGVPSAISCPTAEATKQASAHGVTVRKRLRQRHQRPDYRGGEYALAGTKQIKVS